MTEITNNLTNVRRIVDDICGNGERDIAKIVRLNEAITGGKITLAWDADVRQINEYIVDNIDIMHLRYYRKYDQTPRTDRLGTYRTIREVRKELLNFYGPVVGDLVVKHNSRAINSCTPFNPTEHEIFLRGQVRKDEYTEQANKCLAEYELAQIILKTNSSNRDAKKMMSTAIAKFNDLNKDSSLKKTPNHRYAAANK